MEKVTIFVHKETNKVVSKVCHGCGEIKLNEDFPKFKTGVNYSALCHECKEGDEE